MYYAWVYLSLIHFMLLASNPVAFGMNHSNASQIGSNKTGTEAVLNNTF